MDGDLQRILEEIKSSDVVESRIQLLTQLGDIVVQDKSDVHSLLKHLTTLWEDFTCLDISQCLLNKSILHVASKYLDLDHPGCSLEFLALGGKASQWCAKHLKMSLMSTGESQEEEHSGIFFQLLLDYFRFSTSSLSCLTKYAASDEGSAVAVHKFVMGLFNLTREVISNAKEVESFSSDIIKVAQAVIDSIVRLCKEYLQTWKLEKDDTDIQERQENTICEGASIKSHFLTITADTVQTLSELGILAARCGGSLVAILNTSWKGVITLLELGKQGLLSKVKISDIVGKLISLIRDTHRCAAEAWLSSSNGNISATEAKRTFFPLKFYLLNIVKIVSLFPSEAYVVSKDIALCILMMSVFRFSVSQEKHLKSASEMITDLLEKPSVDLLSALLNSNEVKFELKQSLLDWLFIDEKGFSSPCSKYVSCDSRSTLLADVFSICVETAAGTRILLPGRVVLFLSMMKHSLDFEDDIKLSITSKLDWFLDILIEEEVYSSALSSQVVSVDCSGKKIIWEPLFSAVVLAMKTFTIVVSSSSAWTELESFLLGNLLHPHFLCWEIVMELWCFLIRHGEIDFVNSIFYKLCVVMNSVASAESVLNPASALRKMAKCVCLLLQHCKNSAVDRVFNFAAADSSSGVYLALLMEGFPLNYLSDSLRNKAKQQLVTDYCDFIESFDGKLSSDSRCGLFGAPVLALSASLQTLQVSKSHIDIKTLKFLASIICKYRNPVDTTTKKHCLTLMSETLAIISSTDDLYEFNDMEHAILELQKLFISDQTASETDQLYKSNSKPNLTLFLKGLSNIKMSEKESCPKSKAIWELYQMILKERHWAFVHLAVTAFGHFCARTACNQLWRFVPQDAALAFDLASGREANTERFMSALKSFLEKEQALLEITPCSEQNQLLVKEGKILKELVRKLPSFCTKQPEKMEIGYENRSSKKRKLPEEICKGVELLQNGLKAINDGLSLWQSDQMECDELHEKLLTQFSCLEDMVSHLSGLARTG